MSDPKRMWMPAMYGDEQVPPPRDNPDAWIHRDNIGFFLAANELTDDVLGPSLINGKVVAFDWTMDLGTAKITTVYNETDDINEAVCTPAAPAAPQCGYLFIQDMNDPDNVHDNIRDFFVDMGVNDTLEVCFYAWSKRPTLFRFHDGAFLPIEGDGP